MYMYKEKFQFSTVRSIIYLPLFREPYQIFFTYIDILSVVGSLKVYAPYYLLIGVSSLNPHFVRYKEGFNSAKNWFTSKCWNAYLFDNVPARPRQRGRR